MLNQSRYPPYNMVYILTPYMKSPGHHEFSSQLYRELLRIITYHRLTLWNIKSFKQNNQIINWSRRLWLAWTVIQVDHLWKSNRYFWYFYNLNQACSNTSVHIKSNNFSVLIQNRVCIKLFQFYLLFWGQSIWPMLNRHVLLVTAATVNECLFSITRFKKWHHLTWKGQQHCSNRLNILSFPTFYFLHLFLRVRFHRHLFHRGL